MTDTLGIIFDFNGTLFLDSPKHAKTFKALCHDYGIEEYSDEYIAKNIFGKNNRLILLESYNRNASEDDIKKFDRIKEERYQQLCLEDKECLHLTDGAEKFLDYLKENGIPFCIATGSPMFNIEFYFKHLNLGKWFTLDNIVYDDGSFPCKPAPDVYLKAAASLKVNPKNCIVFEDARSGILSANAAGIGEVYAIVPEGLPSPVSSDTKVNGIITDFTKYKDILKNRF